MLIDVSHLNDEGFADVMKLSDRPVIASHSNTRSLLPTPRNLSDRQIEAIAATGGVIGINGVSSLVGASAEEATLGRLADHMEQIVRVGGEDCLGLGFDFAEKILAPGPPLSWAATTCAPSTSSAPTRASQADGGAAPPGLERAADRKGLRRQFPAVYRQWFQ